MSGRRTPYPPTSTSCHCDQRRQRSTTVSFENVGGRTVTRLRTELHPHDAAANAAATAAAAAATAAAAAAAVRHAGVTHASRTRSHAHSCGHRAPVAEHHRPYTPVVHGKTVLNPPDMGARGGQYAYGATPPYVTAVQETCPAGCPVSVSVRPPSPFPFFSLSSLNVIEHRRL